MSRVLLVEDHPTMRESLRRGLECAGYAVLCGSSGTEGYQLAVTGLPDLMILDLLLPDGDGFQVLSRLRSERFEKPILILTARDSVEHRIQGLELGADDYLVKPFELGELIARLRALARRCLRVAEVVLVVDDLVVDLVTRRVTRRGREIELTPRQFEILAYLIRHKDKLVSRAMLARDIWRERTASWTNVIEVQIANLRKKIESDGQRPLLHTVRGSGYVLGESL